MEYILSANGLYKSYKNFKALNGLSMNVPKGAIYGFVGTLCQIAALKSLRGDKLAHNLALFPVYCDEEQRSSNTACAACIFYK